jgi:hypothetical protein
MQIMEWALADKEAFEQYIHLPAKLILLIPKCHVIFCTHNSFYKTLVEHLSAFIYTSLARGHSAIETTLVTSVLQDNFWLGMVATDLWAILTRSITEQQCLGYFAFWTEIHQELSAAGHQCLFVNAVLQHLFLQLSEETETCEQILTLKPVGEYSALWTVLGLESFAELHFETVNGAIPLMDEFLRQPNDTESLSSRLALVATRPIETNEKFKSKLFEVWEVVAKNPSLRSLQLVIALVQVTLATLKFCSSHDAYKIINLYFHFNSSSVFKILFLRLFVEITRTFGEEAKISSSVARALAPLLDEDDVLVKTLSLEVFNRMMSENIGLNVSSAIFKLRPALKTVLAKYVHRKEPADITADQVMAYLDEHKMLQKLPPEVAAEETSLDFDDDLLIAGFETEMLCTSTQKRANTDSEDVPQQKKVKLKEDCDVTDDVQDLLALVQRVEAKRQGAGVPLSGENSVKILHIIDILKKLK